MRILQIKKMCNVQIIESSDWYAEIDLLHGANCISLRNNKYGARILREPPQDEPIDNVFLYGMPILFPVNRIEGGRFTFEGRDYIFPVNEPRTGCHLHGELHKIPFELIENTESGALCRYRAASGEYLGFPHAFEITQAYALRQDAFYHTVTVTNLSECNMPVFLGFHTTFNTLFTNESRPEDIRAFVDISEEYERRMETDYLPTGVKPKFDSASTALTNGTYKPFDGKLSRHYRGQGRMTLTDVCRGLRIVYENDEKYGFRLIFNGGKDGYICLEPQNCLANCQNSPFSREEARFDYICPGESKTYRSKIFMEELSI